MFANGALFWDKAVYCEKISLLYYCYFAIFGDCGILGGTWVY